MKSAKSILEKVYPLAEAVAGELGYTLWDVEYVKEGTEWYLRITIDSEDGINLEDCERMSRAIDPVLDENDPIDVMYHLEVSSPGVERDIKNDFHISRCIGERVQVKLYAPLDGKKSFVCELVGATDDTVIFRDGEKFELPKKAIAKMNVYFEF